MGENSHGCVMNARRSGSTGRRRSPRRRRVRCPSGSWTGMAPRSTPQDRRPRGEERLGPTRSLRGRSFSLRRRAAAQRLPHGSRHRDRRPAEPPFVAGRRARCTACRREPSPVSAAPRALDPALAGALRALVRGGYGGTAGSTPRTSRSVWGAAWNARARFPGASALKLAIAVTVLRSLDGKARCGARTSTALLRNHARRL